MQFLISLCLVCVVALVLGNAFWAWPVGFAALALFCLFVEAST
jgi:hypothetical protein